MKKLSLLAIMCSVLLITSCETELFNCLTEEGDKEWQEISLDAFHSVDLPGGSKVTFKQGEQNIMVFSTPNVIDALVENGSVSNEIWRTKLADCVRNIDIVEYIITLPTLKNVTISGVGEIFTEGVLTNLTRLDLNISGSGTFDMDLDTIEALNVQVSGVGKFDFAGFVNTFKLDISGSAIVNNFDLIADTCDIRINGMGECEVHVLDELNIDFSGNGKVCYKGTPTVNSNVSGVGQVNDCN